MDEQAELHGVVPLTAGLVMRTDFTSLTPAEASGPPPSHGMAVVLDGQGRLRGVLGPRGPWPAVVVGSSTPLSEVASRRVHLLRRKGLPGLVVRDNGTVVGVIDDEGIGQALQLAPVRGESRPDDGRLSGRAGRMGTPVRIHCGVCARDIVFSAGFALGQDTVCPSGDPPPGHTFRGEWS